jgi:hypothetical protein
MIRRRDDDRQRTFDDLQAIGPEMPPDVIARRLFGQLQAQGIVPQKIRRIALAMLCATEASPKSLKPSSK